MKHIQPVFILGNPRSGTSLLRIMLNQHQNIVATPECGFSHWLFSKYKDWSIADNATRIKTFIEDVQQTKKFEIWGLSDDDILGVVSKYQPTSYADLTKCVYLSYALDIDKTTTVIDKNNYYINHINELPEIWPDAKYVHIIRDGRDVACSYIDIKRIQSDLKYLPNLPSEIRDIATEWVENNDRIASIKDISPERYHLIRYEDLVLDTQKTLAELMRFFALPFDDNMLKYFGNDVARSGEPVETLAWKKKTQEKPDKARIGRYETEMNVDQIDQFNQYGENVLMRYGYKKR